MPAGRIWPGEDGDSGAKLDLVAECFRIRDSQERWTWFLNCCARVALTVRVEDGGLPWSDCEAHTELMKVAREVGQHPCSLAPWHISANLYDTATFNEAIIAFYRGLGVCSSGISWTVERSSVLVAMHFSVCRWFTSTHIDKGLANHRLSFDWELSVDTNVHRFAKLWTPAWEAY
jgi:hypothetical protein